MKRLYLIRRKYEKLIGPVILDDLPKMISSFELTGDDEICGSCSKWIRLDQRLRIKKNYPDVYKKIEPQIYSSWNYAESTAKSNIPMPFPRKRHGAKSSTPMFTVLVLIFGIGLGTAVSLKHTEIRSLLLGGTKGPNPGVIAGAATKTENSPIRQFAQTSMSLCHSLKQEDLQLQTQQSDLSMNTKIVRMVLELDPNWFRNRRIFKQEQPCFQYLVQNTSSWRSQKSPIALDTHTRLRYFLDQKNVAPLDFKTALFRKTYCAETMSEDEACKLQEDQHSDNWKKSFLLRSLAAAVQKDMQHPIDSIEETIDPISKNSYAAEILFQQWIAEKISSQDIDKKIREEDKDFSWHLEEK